MLPLRETAAAERPPLTIVGWLWHQPGGRQVYTVEHANIWARMIHRNLTLPHRFMIVTDQPEGDFDRLITPIPLWNDWRDLKNPSWPATSSNCYVRLKAFSKEAEPIFGPRFVSIDLDILVLKNIDALFDRGEDFLIFRRPISQLPRDELNVYNASMWMFNRAGCRASVWENFKGGETVRAARRYMGTDQAVLHLLLGADEKGWSQADGVYSWNHICHDRRWKIAPPPDAKMVLFYGGQKPWQFASTDKPRCHQCGAVVRVKPPWELSFNRRGASPDFQWIPKNYRADSEEQRHSVREISQFETGVVGAA